MTNLEVVVSQLSSELFGDIDTDFVEAFIDLEISSFEEFKSKYDDLPTLFLESFSNVEETAERWFEQNSMLLIF